jgi:AraC-like DNA-binding protein
LGRQLPNRESRLAIVFRGLDAARKRPSNGSAIIRGKMERSALRLYRIGFIVLGDGYLLRILTAHAEDLLAERHSVTGLQSMVKNQLATLLSSGESGAAAVARRLGMSTRSLNRHLAEEGTTFGEIRERLRQRLATRYLADDRLSVQQAAWLLGYSEPGAFSHAFKRWTGTSPRRARKQQHSPAPS